jgi:hypothetical protein
LGGGRHRRAGNPLALHYESKSQLFMVVVFALAAFLVVTGRTGFVTEAKLAIFSNKLAVAILLAAMLRVRAGWHAPRWIHLRASGRRPFDSTGRDATADPAGLLINLTGTCASDAGG